MNAAQAWNDRELVLTADRFKAISHPHRLAICCILLDGERCVGQIVDAIGTTQPNISGYLDTLYQLKLIRSRKEANRVYYAIRDERLRHIIDMMRHIYCPAD